ncbi:MAG: RNA 2',3'-cyclic phosphodiesterase [Nitriliruptorales bacterium]|nr:RNA 2',3'-cyclic phosphodiesterase [Nitriliruptorales bacterium]
MGLRVFVALPVPEDVIRVVDDAVGALRDRHGDLRWSRPAGWHLTLAFLGQVDEERVPEVAAAVDQAVRQVDVGAIELSVGAAGHFKRRILWLGVDDQPGGAVAALGAAIQRSLLEAELPCEERPVHPHLTLARARGRGRLPRDLEAQVPSVAASWTAETVEVLRSHLGRGGSRYEVLSELALA